MHTATRSWFLLFLGGKWHLKCTELDLGTGFASAGLGDLLLLECILLCRAGANVQASKVCSEGLDRVLDIVLDMAGGEVTEDGVLRRVVERRLVDDDFLRIVGVVVVNVDVHLGILPGARRGRHDFKRPDPARQGPR